MDDALAASGIAVFVLTVVLLMWRPRELNEAVPAAIGGALFFLLGIVGPGDLLAVFDIVSGASLTILSTIVMSIVLDSIGVFRWAAYNIVRYARGSGVRLFWLLNLLCLLMTLFFNNDGSILITTPILIRIVQLLQLKPRQSIPYLLSGALTATASSAPIGVSNLANLIALRIVGLDLVTYAKLMFVPSMFGIAVMTMLLYFRFRRDIPRKIFVHLMPGAQPPSPSIPHAYYNAKTVERWLTRPETSSRSFHPLLPDDDEPHRIPWGVFLACFSIVVLTRIGLFAASDLGVPLEAVGAAGALALIAVRWLWVRKPPADLIRKTPWSILAFAFGIYVVVYGLHNMGLTTALVDRVEAAVQAGVGQAIAIFGLLMTVLSNLFNNLPAVMIGTLSLSAMDLETNTLQLAYLANIVGSDVGALITPFGTLATLLWFHQLRRSRIPFSWGAYLRTTLWLVPITLAVSLAGLYGWTQWLVP